MKTMLFILILTYIAMYDRPAHAQLQAPCTLYSVILEVIRGNYQEKLLWRGFSEEGRIVEVWASDRNRTWSLIIRINKKIACLVEIGRKYERGLPV